MTRLILIRHAKSGWGNPMADDHDRVLTDRGHRASAAIGKWLVENGYLPDITLSSDAARTIETAQGLIAAFDPAPPVELHPMLYHASPDTILEMVTRQTADCIAVIAHNPGIGMLANGLVGAPPAHRRFNDYPTCATTIIDFDGPIRPGSGTCMDFVVPRDLTDKRPPPK